MPKVRITPAGKDYIERFIAAADPVGRIGFWAGELKVAAENNDEVRVGYIAERLEEWVRFLQLARVRAGLDPDGLPTWGSGAPERMGGFHPTAVFVDEVLTADGTL